MSMSTMPVKRGIDLGAFTSVSTGAAKPTGPSTSATVYVNGTFVGTLIVEISADGTNFSPAPGSSSFTAPGTLALPADVPFVRGRCSAFTSGQINAQLSTTSEL